MSIDAETSSEDGLPPLNPMCSLQAAVAFSYAEVLFSLIQQLDESCGVRAEALKVVLDRISHDAVWAVTEVRSNAEHKIRRQRYISQDVFDHWKSLGKHPKPKLGPLAKDFKGETLVHEHVFQRKQLRERLRDANSTEALAEVLNGALACIVSRSEDGRLRRVNLGDGWQRYQNAEDPIRVYDRKERKWLEIAA